MDVKSILYCSSPKFIRNRYTHEYLQVPCGRCAGCITHKNNIATLVYDKHFRYIPFVFFVTLTYAPEFLPVDGFGHGIVSKRDVQLFLKRLRKLFNNEKLFYFIVSEYGPTTFRPHYHCLFGFESSELAENFPAYVFKAWHAVHEGQTKPIGRIDVQSVIGGATAYVTQYLNCNSFLPDYLREFPTFSLKSHLPQTGLSGISYAQLYQFVFSTNHEFNFPKIGKNDSSSLLPWKSFENRFFPKCLQFSRLSSKDRLRLYTLSYRISEKQSRAFCESYRKYQEQNTYFRDRFGSFLLPVGCSEHSVFSDVDSSPLVRSWYISRLFVKNARFFNISFGTYLWLIENYYAEKDYLSLKRQLEFEQSFLDKYGTKYLYCMFLLVDPLFYNNGRKIKDSVYDYYLLQFGGFDSSLSRVNFDLLKILSVNSEKYFQGIFSENTKTKKKNDYLLAHPEYSLK